MKLKLFTVALLCAVTASVACTAEKPNTSTTDPGTSGSQPEELPETIKILAIGNSFSADAVEQELYGLFAAEGQKVIIGDLYIGGCPLEKHAQNAKTDAPAYSYRKIVDGNKTTTESVRMSTALADEDWTFISVQEGAGYHGYYDDTYNGITHSMEPALTDLLKVVKTRCRSARLVYHAPWVAKEGYTGVKFSYYNYRQDVMYSMICKATKEALAAHPEFSLFMNSMDAIQNLRSSYIGDNVTRDGWHLNYSTGRYTAGCLWFEKIMGRSVVGNSYHPSSISDATALVCQTAAHEACEHPYTVTDLSYFEKPSDGEDLSMKTLAKWYFTPERAKSDGCIKTWTGQDEPGVYRYSNEAGERGWYKANGEGQGRLSYVQIDKTGWPGDNAGLSILDVKNGGQPVMCGPMAGDYWQFETTGGYEFAEGTRLHMIYTYNPGNYGAKYWVVEYKDGDVFKPVFEMKTEHVTYSDASVSYDENVNYNIAFSTDQKQVDFTVTLENPTTEFVVRQRCSSSYQVNGKWFDHPNAKCVSRIAGDPANVEKPVPTMSQLL